MLMLKEHASHDYGFFAKVAPKYREKITSELSLIKTQKSSVSSALEEIALAETNIDSHAEKCQDEAEHAFGEMISVLQACKQAMKDEATAYYSSLTGVFDQQKEKLKDIQSKLELVISSVDTTLRDDDQSFLVRLESTFERISNLQKKFQTISLTVAKPRLITIQAAGARSLNYYMKENCFICELAQADMCSVDLTSLMLYVNKQTSFTLTLYDSSGTVCQDGKNQIDVYLVNHSGSSTEGDVEPLSQGQMKILLTPEKRGQHQLNVKVNGMHIKNSPFTITVYVPPKLLSKPVTSTSGLKRPASLLYSEIEDVVFATIMNDGRVINLKVNSQLHVTQHEFIRLYNVNEITHDAALDVFFVTSLEHQLHKLSNDGRIIKTIGRLGKKNVEFDYPNGLRVSKKRELYVCDSRNNRVQIFDLNLNFKRSFGKKGTGKGQFDGPGSIDFDCSGNIYITEENNHRIQIFTCTERHIRIIIPSGPLIQLNTFQPVNLVMHDGNMYITDCYNHKVWVLTTSGEVIATFGEGHLRNPEGITMDKAGFVYVTSHRSKIVVF